MDLTQLSDEDLDAVTKGDMSKVSDAGLDYIQTQHPNPAPPTTPDMSKTVDYFNRNLFAFKDEQSRPSETGGPKEAKSFMDAVDAGWQQSVSGLLDRKKSPDTIIGENAGTFMNIASQAATLVGDLPAMIAGEAAGASAGAAAGSVVPVLGTAVGAFAGGAAGAFAMPTAMRHILMDHYQKGDIKTGAEFMERASATFLDTAKSAGIGVATMGMGKFAGIFKVPGGAVGSGVASKMAEAATMTTLSAVSDGHLPNAKDFIEAALFLGGLHAVHALPKKLMDIYAKTGTHPMDVISKAEEDPITKQELLGNSSGMPSVFQQMEMDLQPKAQQEFNFEKPQPEAPTTRDQRMAYAKKLDPNAFRYLDKIEGDLNTLAEKRVSIEEQIKNIDTTAEGSSEKIKALESDMADVNTQLDRNLSQSEMFKNRITKAYAESVKSVSAIKSEQSKLPERVIEMLAKDNPKSGFVTPETTMDIKGEHQWELDLNTQSGMDGILNTVTQDHPAVNAQIKAEQLTAETSKFTPAENKMFEMIGSDKGAKEGDPFFSKKTAEKFRTNFIDGLNEISARTKDLSAGEKLDPINDPSILVHRANVHTGMVEHMTQFGTFSYNDITKNTGRGFWEIIGEDHTDAMKLKAFMMAKRGIEIQDSGRKPGKKFDRAAAENIVRDGNKAYAGRAKELVQFQNNVLGYLKDSGFFSEAQYKAITESSEAYVPWHRVDPKNIQKGGADFKKRGNPVKELLGSDKDIVDPYVSILKNVDMFVRLAEEQRAKQAFVKLNEAVDLEDSFVHEVKPEKKSAPTGTSEEQIAAAIREPKLTQSGDEYQFTMKENGETRTFKTTKEIYQAFELLGGNKSASNVLTKSLRWITRVKRAGISLTPDFMVKNVIRDYQTSGTFVEGGMFTPKELTAALAAITGKTEVYQDYLKSGGAHNSMLEYSQDYVDRQLNKLQEKTGVWDLGWSTLRTVKDKLAAGAELSEEMTRVAAFTRKAGSNPTMSDLIAGGHASKEATVDFSKVGAKMAAFRMVTAFQGAQIQGADRYVKALTTDFKGTTTRSAITIALPTLLLWAVNRDDERIADLPGYQRDQSYTIPINVWTKVTDEKQLANTPAHSKRKVDGGWEVNTGPILRIPMSQEGGLVFGALLRRGLDRAFKDNREAGNSLASEILSSFTPTVIPDFALPAVESYFNKDMFTGNKLIPYSLEGEVPEHIYTPYTSELAKGVGKLIGSVPGSIGKSMHNNNPANPIIVDHWIKSWTGSIGNYTLQMLDGAVHGVQSVSEIATKPGQTITGTLKESMDKLGGYVSALQLSDIAFVKSFAYRYPSMGMQPIQDFYNESKTAQEAATSIENMIKKGDSAGAQREININKDYYMMAKPMKDAQASIGQMSIAIKAINESKSMSDMDKRHQIDGLYYMINTISKTMLDQLDQAKKMTEATGIDKTKGMPLQ